MTVLRPLAAVILTVLMAAFPARTFASSQPAHTEKLLGIFGAWRTYTYDEAGQRVCYMVTTKRFQSKGPQKRATPYLMITHRPVEASTDVFSYGAGTLLDQRRGVKIQMGKSGFDLFSVRDIAWARDGLTDHKIAAALQKAPTAQASAFTSKKGVKKISDTFDLKGADSAYQSIGKACGLVKSVAKKNKNKITVTPSRKAP